MCVINYVYNTRFNVTYSRWCRPISTPDPSLPPIIWSISVPHYTGSGIVACINLKKQNRREWKRCAAGTQPSLSRSSAHRFLWFMHRCPLSTVRHVPGTLPTGWLIYKVDKVRYVGCLRVVVVEVMARQPYLAVLPLSHCSLCSPYLPSKRNPWNDSCVIVVACSNGGRGF